MTAKPVRSDSVAVDEPSNDIVEFMRKYEALDKDRRKYMICFFALFALVIIFLIIILVGLTANDNSSTSNIDTCNADCASTGSNDFVTLTDKDTQTPIATFNGYLDVYLQNTSLTNYTRILSNNGTMIDDLYTYLYQLKESLETEDGVDVYISVQRQIFQGNVDYDYLVKSCNILYTG